MNPLDDKKSSSVTIDIITCRDALVSATKYSLDSRDEYEKKTAQIHLSKEDLKKLGINKKKSVKLSNNLGSIIVEANPDPKCPEGLGFMPLSKLANKLTSYDPSISNNPNYKSIKVLVEALNE